MRTYQEEVVTVVSGRFVSIPFLPSGIGLPKSFVVQPSVPDVELDSLADTMTGDSSDYWQLVAANYTQFTDAFDIPEGVALIIPTVG